MTDCCALVFILFQSEEPHQSPNISSGCRYDSYRGHAFIIGGRSKGIIGIFLYSKAAEKRVEEAEEHECPKNFELSSKSMEASAILNMV